MNSLAVVTFLIVFREGLEALLVVAALAAFLMRAGESHRLGALAWGGGLALLASLVAALIFTALSGDVGPLAEAFMMLCIALLVFHVSAWLWRFRNLQAWQRHLEEKVGGALRADSSLMLGGIAFLAVFREGAETILFLYGVLDDGTGTLAALVTGVVSALVVLAFCYWLMTRLALRLPLRPMFAVTSCLLFLLGLHFIGVSMDEFQAAGWLPADQIVLPGWLLGLGINPSLETLGLQLLLIVAALLLLWRTSGRPDRTV